MYLSRRRILASGLTLLPVAKSSWSFHWHNEKDQPPELTSESIAAVKRGFQWLRKTEVSHGAHGTDIGARPNVGCTAITGLALLADGSTPQHGLQKKHLNRIVEYLVGRVERMTSGNISPGMGSQLQSDLGIHAHSFFALLFLGQVAGEVKHPKRVREAIKKLTDAVVKAQLPSGDWGQEAWAPILGTVMGWESLRSANFAGFTVGGSPDKTAQHLIQQMKRRSVDPDNWMHTLYKNATGLRVLYAMGLEEEEVAKKALDQVMTFLKRDNTAFNQAGGEDYLAFHLVTEAMLQKEDKDWDVWFPMVRDKVIRVQNKDGSWTGHHCITSRTFCTAAACLVLSAPNRFLPISQP